MADMSSSADKAEEAGAHSLLGPRVLRIAQHKDRVFVVTGDGAMEAIALDLSAEFES